MKECALRGVTVDLCVGKSECWSMCLGNKFGCRFWEMRECVLLCVFRE